MSTGSYFCPYCGAVVTVGVYHDCPGGNWSINQNLKLSPDYAEFLAVLERIAKALEVIAEKMPNPKYYTPPNIAEMAAGSGAFLKDTIDKIIGNPPYESQDEP